MLVGVFTVFDSKAEVYLPPFYARTSGEAIRMFATSANENGHEFCKYPADYTLFRLGNYDDQNAKFDLDKTPGSLGLALEHQTNPEITTDDLNDYLKVVKAEGAD